MADDFDTANCFFHYTTREAAFEHILPSGKLRFSTYERMRDPMENKEWYWSAAFFVNENEPPETRERAYFTFHHLADAIRRQAHLLALTVDADGYGGGDEAFGVGWSRARMWEHYAEKHAGVCLVFDRERLTKNIEDDLFAQLNIRPYHHPVEYTPDGHRGALILDLGSVPVPVEPDFVQSYIEDHHYDLFFQKTWDWQSEHEYRFVTTAPPDQPLYASYGDALVDIVAGEKFPDWERAGALEAGRRLELEPHIMNWEMRSPFRATLKLKPWLGSEEAREASRKPPQADPPRPAAP